jgi:hypothetical protein
MKYRHVASRLTKVEARLGVRGEENPERNRRLILEKAEHTNLCANAEDFGMHPLFDIRPDGVYCTVDGKKLTHWSQVGAEFFYWFHVYAEFPWFIHNDEAQAFYSIDGELCQSRDYTNVCAWGRAERAWERRDHLQAVSGGGVSAE